MSETTIVLGPGRAAGLLRRNDWYRRSVGTCATCNGKRYVHRLDHRNGFCLDCLERSRVLDEDDIGGES
jgi:hypothetical protein